MHIIGAYVAFIAMVNVLDCTQQYGQVDALILRLSMERAEPEAGNLAPTTAGELMAPLQQEGTAEPPTPDYHSTRTRRPDYNDPLNLINKYTIIFSVTFLIGLILFSAWACMGSPIHYTTDNDGVRWENGDSGDTYEWRTASKELSHDRKHMGYKYGDDMNLSAHDVNDVNRKYIAY